MSENSLRSHFLLDPEITFLNHGSYGATPRPVLDDFRAWQELMEREPVKFLYRERIERLAHARTELAEFLDTHADNLVYVTNATTAINIIAHSLSLGEGDEVLTTDHEYGAAVRTWRFVSLRKGFALVTAPIAVPLRSHAELIDSLFERVTPRTKVIFLSHITSETSAIFPLREICTRAQAQGILTVIDGAHAPGQISLSLSKLGADFYAGNLHKWVCAPKGAGFLYAKPDRQALLEPLIVSWGWEPRPEEVGVSPFIDQQEWQGTRDLSSFLAVPAALKFQKDNQWFERRERCRALLHRLEESLIEMLGGTSLYSTEERWYQQMLSFPLPLSCQPEELQRQLFEDFRIEIPIFSFHGAPTLRASCQVYNEWSDYQRLLDALSTLVQS